MFRSYRKILSLLLACTILFSLTIPASAAQISEVAPASTNTIYLNDWADFDYGTSLKNLENNMGHGSYTLYYSVTKPTTLILWYDSFSCKEFPLSGSGTLTIENPSFWDQFRAWSCLSDYSSVSVSFTITN